MSRFIFGLLVAFALIFVAACSSSNQNPISSKDSNIGSVNFPSSADELQNGKNFLGSYIMTFDPETWETEVVPDRSSTVLHFNITGYLFSPPCPSAGCFQCTITDWTDNILTIDLVLANPTSLAPYDVRQVFTHLNGKTNLNPDGYTDIFDPPSTPEEINPFIAYAKDEPNRRFPAGPWSIIHEELIIEFPVGALAATG